MQKQSVTSSIPTSSSSSSVLSTSSSIPVPYPVPVPFAECSVSGKVSKSCTLDAGREFDRRIETGARAGIKDNDCQKQKQKKTATCKPRKNMKKSIESATAEVQECSLNGNMLTQVPVVLKRKRSNTKEKTKNVPENQKKRTELSLREDDNFQMGRLMTDKNQIASTDMDFHANEESNDEKNNYKNVIEGGLCADLRKEDRNMKQIVLSFLRSQSDLYMMILCFEPLDLDSVHKRLLSQNLKISKPELLEILDSEFFFVSCGMVAKARKRENKKLTSKQSRNRSKK